LKGSFKDIVENYLAGILIGLRQPFASRDFIEVAEHQGLVIRLTARELVLMTPQGNQVRLPNAIIFRNVLINYTRNPRLQFSIRIGVDSNADLKRVEHLARTTPAAVKGVLTEPAPLVMIQELADFNVIIECFAWVDQRETDFFKVRSQAIRLLKEAFDKARIGMPEPIMNVWLSQTHKTPLSDLDEQPTPDAVTEAVIDASQWVDVDVEHHLERQIEEDIAMSDEEDLLKRDR
jgi:small conductance mechanosensitive channel